MAQKTEKEMQEEREEAAEEQRIQEEKNPQNENAPPPPPPGLGKVLYNKDNSATAEEIEEADIIIEEKTMVVVTKDRNGLTGVVATPEMIEAAEADAS